MPTALWTGSLSFGLVVIPVRLYPAVRKKVVRFREIDASGRRIRHVRVADPEPQLDYEPGPPSPPFTWTPSPAADVPAAPEIPFEEIRKGFEIAPGQYVSLTREEVQALAPERSRSIDVEQFVDRSAVDPIYFESRYYVAPDRGAVTAFQLLRDAMLESDRMAIAWITLRQRRYLAAIRPFGDEVMLLTTMVHADEVQPVEFWMPEPAAPPSEKELKMARMLVDALAGPFVPERFTDEHRERVLKAIEQRKPIEAQGAPPSPTRVLDLMAALEASVKAAKAARAKEEREQPKPERKRKRG
ncbi:MAG TPA: Ku protein [Candidatus Dormibacteraeota bacterium]|nr:Ku protein [Candidatus Dormibacteraeota bacterium]